MLYKSTAKTVTTTPIGDKNIAKAIKGCVLSLCFGR